MLLCTYITFYKILVPNPPNPPTGFTGPTDTSEGYLMDLLWQASSSDGVMESEEK